MMKRKLIRLCSSASAGLLVLGMAPAFAEEAEDSSSAFKADMAELSATHGVPDAESTVSISDDGVMSAVVGVSAMKMLVVRQNDDGSLSYGHVSSEEEAEAFAESGDSNKAAEE